MADLQTITIQFKPKGDEVLVRAIKKLDNATRELQGQQKRYRKETEKLAPETKKLKKQIQALKSKLDGTAKSTKKVNKANKAMLFGIRNLRNAGGRFSRVLSKWRSKLLIISFAIGLVTAAFKKMFDRMIVQEKAEKQLEVALGKTSIELKNYAAALQQKTEFGDEAIISGMALIASVIKDEEAIKKATEATLDLASAKGMDLKTASDLVAKTLGSSTNALSRYGITVAGAIGSTERLDILTRNISVLFGGQAAAAATTLGGAVAQMSNAFGDLNEAIGVAFQEQIRMVMGDFKNWSEGMTETLKKMGETELETIARHIEETGGNADDLRKIIDDIKMKDLREEAEGLDLGKFKDEFEVISLMNADFMKDFKGQETELNKMIRLNQDYSDRRKEILNTLKEENLELIDAGVNVDEMLEAAGKGEAGWKDFFFALPEAGKDAVESFLGQTKEQIATQGGFVLPAAFNIIHDFAANLGSAMGEANIELSAKSREARRILENYLSSKETLASLDELQKEQLVPIIQLLAQIQALEGEGTVLDPVSVTAAASSWDEWQNAINGVTSAYNNLQQAQLTQFRKEELARINSIRSERKKEKEMKKFEAISAAREKKANKKAQEIAITMAIINTTGAILKTWDKYGMTPTGYALTALMAITGAMQIATIKAQKFERGGLIGGRRHSAGGTMIEAERGEFVMSRSAVNAVGVETMNRINAGGGAGNINISFAGNVMSDDFISEEAIPKIKEAIRRGADIGVS